MIRYFDLLQNVTAIMYDAVTLSLLYTLHSSLEQTPQSSQITVFTSLLATASNSRRPLPLRSRNAALSQMQQLSINISFDQPVSCL
jgi:hypothetical protein